MSATAEGTPSAPTGRSVGGGLWAFVRRDLPKPTDADLRSYFEENRERFTRPASLTLDHVFFRDRGRIPDGALAHLRSGGAPGDLNDDTPASQRRIVRADQRRLVEGLSADGARAVLAINDDLWHGPILSPQGAHFVRIAKSHSESRASFEEVASYLQGDWLRGRAGRLPLCQSLVQADLDAIMRKRGT